MMARYCGIQIGMTLSQAYQQCPEGIFLTPALKRYQAAWDEVYAIPQQYTPKVEPLETSQAFLDLTGCLVHLDPWSAAEKIVSHIRSESGIDPWMGVATNRVTAQLASTQGGITVIEPG